jgi:uncharacterized protein (TIGR00251 family)
MIIRVRVIPKSTTWTEIAGRIGSTVRVKLASADIDGAANAELVEFLSEFFEVSDKSVKILRGEKGKEKTVEIEGRPEEELEEIMESIP